ncbi:MAG: hypothetical protein KC994_23465, partial [Candidatus Omnitrophica bacterium]|nr:hypothetical protein [Candidatus Omnitrophota bacterium]
YMEKPMTMGVGESLAVKRAVDKHKRITQIGTQIHAESNYRKVVDIVRSGVLGKISVVRTTNVGNQGPDGIGHTPNSDPPEGLDWDMWCGPDPMRSFNPLIVKRAYENSSFMEYSNGWTPGMAPHIIDLPYWALELGHPTCVSSSGGRYIVDDVGNAYDTHEALFQYPDMTLTWGTSIVNAFGLSSPPPTCKKRNLAISFQGVNGTLVTDYNEQGNMTFTRSAVWNSISKASRMPLPNPRVITVSGWIAFEVGSNRVAISDTTTRSMSPSTYRSSL